MGDPLIIKLSCMSLVPTALFEQWSFVGLNTIVDSLNRQMGEEYAHNGQVRLMPLRAHLPLD